MIAPTIIVGVGGIGSDICCRVSKLVGNNEQRSRIRFVCIDTDINDLNRRKREDSRIRTIQTSAPYVVANYLETNTRAKDEWFPNYNILMGKTPTEGAGQVRAISRLAFDEAVRKGEMQTLDKAIEELYFLNGAAQPQAVRVIIVSTLAGGTGSGIVLPVALYIRNFLETRFRKNASVVRGFFLLPEILFGGKSPEERKSLCCNAYASIRELDAFMRRADNMLEMPRYSNLKLELPDSTTNEYVDYHVAPFNFCFLYDKRNTDDLQLMSAEDYIEHAANTIYTQTVSGISSRSNSNEDNAIKGLVSSMGRNRYCGAGSSLMKYPRDSVLKYIAGKWCVSVMDSNWLAIDKSYEGYLQTQRENRKKNPGLKDMSLQDYYINKIEHCEEKSFEEQILIMCSKTSQDEEGKLKREDKIDDYLKVLEDYLREELQADPEVAAAQEEYINLYNQVFGFYNKDNDDEESEITKDTFRDYLAKAMEAGEFYVSKILQAAGRVSRVLDDQLFSSSLDYTEDDKPYRIETYMRDSDKNFIHPNAARYFLYKLEKKYREREIQTNNDIRTDQSRVYPYDDASTPERENAARYLEGVKVAKRYLNRFVILNKDEIEDIEGKMTQQNNAAIAYGVHKAMASLCHSAADHIKICNDAFEVFYKNFDGYLKATHSAVADIERRYVNGDGKATRYVCCSEKCLSKMLEEMPCSGTNNNINGPLSALIYQKVIEFAKEGKKPNPSLYFQKTFDEHIMKSWEDAVLRNYQTRIDMDIITALQAEAEYESDEPLTAEQINAYVVDKLKQAERLAAPFIEEPMGEIRHPFNICAYNPAVEGEPDSARRQFVKRYLNDEMSGQPDENVSIYELMVYKAIYNMNAGDLKRFRAPERPGGASGIYYAAYIDTIRQLGTNTLKNRVLTPHIDRRWHLVKYLPDLDDFNQRILEKKVYTALCWGMITGKIEQTSEIDEIDGTKRILYRPKSRHSDEFVVSNKSKCDELYEVLDALGINPPLVEEIISDFHDTMIKEKMECVDLYNSLLMSSMNWFNRQSSVGIAPGNEDAEDQGHPFKIRQYLEGTKQKPSIFDLIYWIKYSTPGKEFTNKDVERMLTFMLEMLEEYVGAFVGEERKYDRCYMILADQFALFLENLQSTSIDRPKNRFRDKCVHTIRVNLDARIRDVYKMESKKCEMFTNLYNTAEEAYEDSGIM